MFAAFVRFAVTVAAVPLCAEYLDGVKMLDLTNALVVARFWPRFTRCFGP